jgi:hypothetical protein
MLKQTLMFGMVAVAAMASNVANAATASKAQAAELTLHRIERLVTLKIIDAGYMAQFQSMVVESLSGGGAGKPTFKTTSSQAADTGKAANKLEITLDDQAKAISFNAIEGVAATKPTAWPDKDPVTLAESSLHYIEANIAKPDIAKFNSGLKTLSIGPANVNGKDVALVLITSSDIAKTLRVVVGLDGVVVSSDMAP